MRLLPQSAGDVDWPSRTAIMDHHPIVVTIKDDHIIHATLYEGRDQFGLLGEVADLTYHTGEYTTLEGGEFNPVVMKRETP